MKIVVIIPAYNEEKRIKNVISQIKTHSDEIIVVDDGSKDDTYGIVSKDTDIIALQHDINLGKGAALKTGCEAAKKINADIIVCMDADGQHKAEDIPRFIEAIKQGNDIVFGSRTIGKGMPLMMFLGNKFLSSSICKLFKIFINDTQSGFRAFTKSAYEKIAWESNDYAVETEMIIRAAKKDLKYKEIEIETIYHDDYKGTTPVNGLQIFIKILKWRYL
ncbi:MAG: glycosyltransferase family 2 protein [Patescibacteria group bacterium]